MIKVFGHKAPDTDTVCSAIIWSWYLNAHTTVDAKPYILGEINTETSFVLNHFNIDQPDLLEESLEGSDVVIVDTNNPDELPDDINKANIKAIIDHHRLIGGLTNIEPVEITMRKLGSTASVLYTLIKKEVDNIPDDIAGLILSCILSDTLEFRSPTTTPQDEDIANNLAKQLGIDIHEYANQMFEAKSDISSFTDIGLVRLDSKKYDIGENNIRISVIETTTPEKILSRISGITSAIKEVVEEEHDTDDVLFFVIDILKEESTVLIQNDFIKNIVEKSFGVSVKGDTHILPGVISRKKQIIPNLKV